MPLLNRPSARYPRYLRWRWNVLFVLIALLALPYLVDVVYFGDFTPTHFAQENLIEEEIQNFGEEDVSWPAESHVPTVRGDILLRYERFISSLELLSWENCFPLQYLIAVSRTSRPPPAL